MKEGAEAEDGKDGAERKETKNTARAEIKVPDKTVVKESKADIEKRKELNDLEN